MASEEPPSPTSSGKHRRSADDDHGADASSKRRKHHHRHHRHHRRRRRHHIRHGRESDDGADEAAPLAEAEPEAETLSSPVSKPVDDEREEGEILEEDEELAGPGGGKVDGFKVGGVSDAEAGESKPHGADVYSNLIGSGKDTYSGKSFKMLSHIQNKVTEEKMLDLTQSCENSSWKGAAQMKRDFSDGDSIVWKTENISLSDAEKEILNLRETVQRQSKSLEQSEYKHMHTDRNDTKVRVRSRSPVSKQCSQLVKHRKRDNHEIKGSDSESERLDSRHYMESRGANRSASDKTRSILPKSLHDRYREARKSPSSNHNQDQHRDRSMSCDHSKRQSYENISQFLADGDDQVDSKENRKDDSGRKHRLDRYAASNQAGDRELQNQSESSSKGRNHNKHGSQERYRERERNNSSVRDSDNMEWDNGFRRERERSSSYSRYDRQDDRHEMREREKERERYSSSIRDRVRDKLNDMSREKYVAKERLRDSRHERDRTGDDRDKYRARDRDAYAHKDRVHGGQMERDRISSRMRHRESRHSKYDVVEHHKDKSRSKEAGSGKNNPEEDREKSVSGREEEEDDYQERIEQQLAKQDEEDVDKIKEESRKRRQAILEKYRQRQLQQDEFLSDGNENAEKTTLGKGNLQGLHDTSVDNRANNEELENRHDSGDVDDADPSFTVGKSPVQNGASTNKKINNVGGLGEGTPKSERSADMFSDDIFGKSPAGVCKMGKVEGPQTDRNSLHDNWDDAEGYYSYRFGEVLDGRYEVIAAHGKGVFSTVVRARDLKAGKSDPEEVAIKIIRNNETMYKAGQDELVILKKLAGADPEDKRHCVRFLSSFKYRNHLCLVFESLHMNLREVLKKFGRNIGLKLTAVRAYAKQLFIALKHLRNCGVLHCDIKPDNMLVNEAKNVLKLCDFGNAMFAGKNEITPYLVSRFYRAPEIILGLPYDHPMDMWSVGCCLYELYTGKVLFPGPSNNDMLRLHMELKGPFPKKMLRKGAFTDQHFDQDLSFHATEEDPVTKKPVKRLLLNIKPKDIGALISGFPGEDLKMLSNFKDLLDRIFVLDPEKRMTVSQTLSHPFITGK